MRYRLRSGHFLLTTPTDCEDVTRFAVICLIIAYTLIVNEKNTSMHPFVRVCVFNIYYEKKKKHRFGFRHWFVLIGNGIGFRWQKINNVMRDLAYLSFLTGRLKKRGESAQHLEKYREIMMVVWSVIQFVDYVSYESKDITCCSFFQV